MASVQLPPSRFLSNAVAVQLNGTLDKLREDTSQGPQEIPQWTGNWTYGQSNLAVVPLPFSYKRASTPGTLPAWQWALVNGESDDRVADLFDPPETQPLPTLQSAPTLQPPPPARHSSSDQIPTQASQPQDPSTQPHASSTHSTNVSHPPVNLPPSSAPATPSTLPPTQTQPHTPDDSWDVSGWWEGSFELQNKQGKQGKVNTIREKFYLRRLEEGRVVGGGTNAYGRFQLYGVLKDVNKLECARAYLQMPRRKRRRPSESVSSSADASGGAAGANYNTRKRKTPSKFEAQSEVEVDPSSIVSPKIKRSQSFSQTPASTEKKKKKKPSTEDGEVFNIHNLKSATHLPAKDGWLPATLDEEANEIYEGEVNEAQQRHGYGLLVYCSFDNHIYEGEFINGKESGRGTLMQADRKVIFDGEWQDGRIHGRGTYYFPSGDVYTGEWKENTRHGKGTYSFYRGAVYEGDWKDNLRSGRGVFTWPDGSSYDGDWQFDQRHGRGTLELSAGLHYEGQWSRNRFDGRGVCIHPNGLKYEGMWKAGKREGRGSLTFPNGVSYEGRFRDDKIDGQGTIKISEAVFGIHDTDWMIPVQFQSDLSRIHAKAGFDTHGK